MAFRLQSIARNITKFGNFQKQSSVPVKFMSTKFNCHADFRKKNIDNLKILYGRPALLTGIGLTTLELQCMNDKPVSTVASNILYIGGLAVTWPYQMYRVFS